MHLTLHQAHPSPCTLHPAPCTLARLGPDQFHFLSYLLSRPALSLKDVTTLCLSLFTDGLSTTTPTVLFNLHCLAAWPEVQEKVHAEVEEQVRDGAPITTATLANLPYLKAFVKETFRLWPNGTEVSRCWEPHLQPHQPSPSPSSPRYCEQDLTLSGHHVPAGTHLDLNPSVHFQDPDIFPEVCGVW